MMKLSLSAGTEKTKERKEKFSPLIKREIGSMFPESIKKKKFVRPTQENPQGGEIEIERSIHISNVMLFDSKKKKGVRIGFEIVKGKKERINRGKGNK